MRDPTIRLQVLVFAPGSGSLTSSCPPRRPQVAIRGSLRPHHDTWRKQLDTATNELARLKLGTGTIEKKTATERKENSDDEEEDSEVDREEPPEKGSRQDQLCEACEPTPTVR